MARRPRKKPGDEDAKTAFDAEALLVSATESLKSFLDDNPPAHLSIEEAAKGPQIRVMDPWGDSSLAFRVDEDHSELASALNNVRLPKRLSAIWHRDTGDLEIIWTAYNLPKPQVEIAGREFDFSFKGKKHSCKFGEASQRVRILGQHFIPIQNSATFFRNLYDTSRFMSLPNDRLKDYGYDIPRSFWIKDIKWNEERINELVTNLNFYLTYFDDRSPQVLLHDVQDANEKATQKVRYIRGEFPASVDAKELDNNLLSFWNSAESGDPMMRFLLYFRIIEYATTHYIDSAVKSELRKILLAPDLQSNIPGSLDKIVASVTLAKLEDTTRFKALIRHCVDPKLIWKDVEANQAFFAKETKFDGGFSVKPLVSMEDKEATFCTRGLDSFSDSVRKIRNALSHGKDQETAGVITPSTRNIKLFQPWVHLIATAAGEVVLYKDAT